MLLHDHHVDPPTEVQDARGVLPDKFWTARPVLAHIADAARARRVPPSAAFGALLARLSAMVPPSTTVPAFVGTTAPLSTFVAIVAETGGGKSSASGVAQELLDLNPAHFLGDQTLGSGEGLIDCYLGELEAITDANGTPVKVRRQRWHGVAFALDEGRVLAELASRKGSTVLPTLCGAWSGSTIGQANVRGESFRRLERGNYAVGLVGAFQPTRAAALFDDVDGGTPGRFVWLRAIDPQMPTHAPQWPGALSLHLPALIAVDGRVQAHPLTYSTTIWHEVDAEHLARQRGQQHVEPLDAHRTLARLKVAGLLAILEDRREVTDDDWLLANVVMATSDQARAYVLDSARWQAREREQAANARAVRREAAIADDAHGRAVARMAQAVARRAHRDGTITRREATQATAGRDRQVATLDEAIDRALQHEWIARDGEHFTPGRVTP